HADAQPRVLLRAERRLDRLEAIVSARTAPRAESYTPGLERHVVDDDQQVARDVETGHRTERCDGRAAPVHVRHRLDQPNGVVAEAPGRDDGATFTSECAEAPRLRQVIEKP